MKILFITESFPPDIGGVAVSARRMVHTLARLGHEVQVFSLDRTLPSGYAASQPERDGVTGHRFGCARSLDFTLQQAMNFLQWLHRQHTFAVLWGHYVETAGFLAAWLGGLWNLPSVLSVRGNDLDRQLLPPGDLARLAWCLQSASCVLAVSQDLAHKVRVLVNRDALVVPNAVDTDLFRPAAKPLELAQRYGIRPEEVVLVFSGELRAKKGLQFLLEAFQQVLRLQPARLLIIGAVRPKDRGAYTRASGIDPTVEAHITLTGHLPSPHDVAQHLLLGDVFLLPSLWDGMPNSLLEAMAAGIPVIASDAGGIAEVVRDGVNGFLLPRTHLHRLADRIEALLSLSAAQRARLTTAARQTVCTHHSLAAEATRLGAILAALPSSRS